MKVCFVTCNKEGYVRNKAVMNGLNMEIVLNSLLKQN